MTRIFDATTWGAELCAAGDDVLAGEVSLREESLRRKVAFYLDAEGLPLCQSSCDPSQWHPTLVTRMTSVVVSHGRAVVSIDAALPLHSSILDIAFPGAGSGGSMMDITIVDLSRHRRTLHAEVPSHLVVTGTIAVALSPVGSALRTAPSGRTIGIG
ncbi:MULTISPECIES: hypothetical protein [Gordonia]|uniref:Uncharacterized protein n=1 Tax=Gordonia amicalis TaxID=89053 RepID=A0AAE4U7D0_9ACTN|nr:MULTISPECIES: hypothetical protein [Gordonia]ATD69158.1 hypothetical protein CNO18_01405 [Gordonia sp. 1D]KAF0968986.1 hypothetical protein BPODLACK_02643 [Gordonia sp. YY1]MBA5847222.1 hypothetical protein [Gordonia amicalis]MCZ4580824.1 hypothetical protein [Gordonia amicalis]MCZ4653997.1 hypothetical protein [Gordonia amicalis]